MVPVSVHIDGKVMRSCSIPITNVEGSEITTIEGLSENGNHPVQQAWREMDVPQCGYCQTGQIMAATDLLERIPNPTDDDIEQNINNLCRCGTYVRIRKAIHRAVEIKRES